MSEQNIRILITGGSGFIGTNLVDYYLTRGFTVVSIDKDSPRNKKHNSIWKEIDILDYDALEKAILNFSPTYVLHLAARTDLDEKKNITGYQVNTQGQKNILKVLDKCPSLKRAIFASSMLVCRTGYIPKDYNDYNPPNLYGESKVLSERIIKDWNSSSYEWSIVRPTSIWGPWFGSPYKDFFSKIKNRTYFKIAGKSATKTFGYIGNTIHQFDKLLFLEVDLINQRTFYLGDNPPLNVNAWADMISKQLNIKIPTLPFFALKIAAVVGECLGFLNIKFPMTSFRLSNMTTNNIITLLDDTTKIIPDKPFSTEQGITNTLKWMREQRT